MTSTLQKARCPVCWSSLQLTDRFCYRCGTSLPLIDADNESTENSSGGSRKRIGGSGWVPETTMSQVDADPIDLASAPSAARKRKSRSRRSGRIAKLILPVTVAVAIFLGGLAGRALTETGSTLDKLHSVSTPPPQVSDATVRDDPPEADNQATGGNLGAVPASESSENLSGTTGSDVQSVPAPTATTGTGQSGAIDGTDSSTSSDSLDPAQTPVSGVQGNSEIDSSANQLNETTTGSVSSSTDSVTSSTAVPVDAEALAEEQLAGGLTFDTAPAVAAIAQYQQEQDSPVTSPGSDSDSPPESNGDSTIDDGGGFFGSLADKGGQLRDAAEGAAIAAGISDPDSRPLTILIMGVDARPGSAIDIGVRPDALMVLRLDPESGTCRGLAVPRDSYVELPGYGMTKINHALMLGGIPYEQLVVENYLGIEIDHYALIDFTGFAALVDAVGGITIDVPPELASPAVPAGVQTIDGESALLHARYRGGPDGDFGRIQRQQQIMRGLIATAEGRDLLTEANRLLSGLQEHIRTDLELDELVSLAETYRQQCTVDGLDMEQIPGEVVYGPLIDPLFNLPLSYVVSEASVVDEMVERLLEN